MPWKLVVVMMSFSDTGAASTSMASIPDIRQEQACRTLEAELSTDSSSEQLGHKYLVRSKGTCVEDADPAPPQAVARPRPAQASPAAPSQPPVAAAPPQRTGPPRQANRYEPPAERYNPYEDRYYPRGAARVPGQFEQ